MPLLKKRQHVNEPLPENLRDDEEIFHCNITDEIFRDYDKFAEKILMYNSMVWTCCMTGKSRLTFQEALDSEKNAKKILKDFPVDLKTPILFIANKTQRTSFGDMAEDVFIFIKDRYFMGENLESSFTGSKWKDSHVLTVIAPSEEQLKSIDKIGPTRDREFWPPASEFKYEIEHLDDDDKDISEVMIVGYNQIRRKRGKFNRDKCKLFLKQHVELDSRGVFVIKETTTNDFGLNQIRFDQIFDGPLPNFEISKKLDKVENNGKPAPKKRAKQETLSKYLIQMDGMVTNQNNGTLLENMRKREEEFKLNQQKKMEERLESKNRNKLTNIEIEKCMKNWYTVKDDLFLDNQKALPVPTPVKCKVPDEHLLDMFSIMEFVQTFPKLLNTKDFFPLGLTFELMERALTETEIAGPFNGLIQMFLTAIFKVQDEESNQHTTTLDVQKSINEDQLSENLSLEEASKLATAASRLIKAHQGVAALGHLPLYSVTVTEIVRLHLLCSGARIADNRWRYAERGGYEPGDDPGLHFCLNHPHILKALALHDVIQLPIADRLQIVLCLKHQLMTYADVRDAIEERVEKSRQLKLRLRSLKWGAKTREHAYMVRKRKLERTFKNDNGELTKALEELQKENDDTEIENCKEIKKMYKRLYDYETFMGMDRAFRRYLRLDSVPGLFVTIENDSTGNCLDAPVQQLPEMLEITKSELRNHFKQKVLNNIKSPQKHKMALPEDKRTLGELLMCTTDPESCPVHSVQKRAPRWAFFHKEEQIENLLKSLNSRGERERELLEVLQNHSRQIINVILRTPISALTHEVQVVEEVQQRNAKKKKGKNVYKDSNLGYPSDKSTEEILESSLVDNILEMEEKMFVGNLGRLDNRDEWRTFLTNKNYNEIEELHKKDKSGRINNNNHENSPDSSETDKNEYKDPGRLLTMNARADLYKCPDETDISSLQKSIKALAFALSQVARALNKHLKAPLGHNLAKKDRRQKIDLIDKWEESLLASTSYSQVFLHYATLDSCIMWSKSALLARCKVCRLKKDAENMLLCSDCNLGHHLYCLRPVLQSIPKGDWYCGICRKEREKDAKTQDPEPAPARKRRIFLEEEIEEEQEYESANESEKMEESECTDETDEEDTCSVCSSAGDLLTCEKCLKHFHMECCNPPLRRPPRGTWNCFKCVKKDRDKEKVEEGLNTRNNRTFPLHNVELQELLSDVMKHEDAWPFIRPVQTKEVPDYYDVIRQPMDFGTIKYNLNMGKYTVDIQLMQDVALIFRNCDTYNKSDDEVYKCGAKLLKYFIKRAKELDLEVPKEIEAEDQEIQRAKKRRIK